jgi:hypothetical protein
MDELTAYSYRVYFYSPFFLLIALDGDVLNTIVMEVAEVVSVKILGNIKTRLCCWVTQLIPSEKCCCQHPSSAVIPVTFFFFLRWRCLLS